MKINLFSVTIFIENIDLNKINLDNKGFEETWESKTISSHNFTNQLTNESSEYILRIIGNVLKQELNINFFLKINSIWENKYIDKDYQEKHLHPGSHFSFIIYKDVEKSNTTFIHLGERLISSYIDNAKELFKMFPILYKPVCTKGQIVIFPSFLEHMVLKNSKSLTIAGNLNIDFNKKT